MLYSGHICRINPPDYRMKGMKTMSKANKAAPAQRMVYLDIIRIAAIFSVIIIHVTTCEWYSLPVASLRWQVLNLFNAANRWCIAGFVLMSGRAFLDPAKPVSFAVLFKKNVLRMLFSLIFWSTAYHLYETALVAGRITAYDLLGGITSVYTLSARRHLWFLYLMIGLYLLTPALRRLVERLSVRTLVGSSIALLLISGITPLVLYGTATYAYMQYVMQVPGFIGLFILGYCLDRVHLSARTLRLLCAAGVFGALFTIVGTSIISVQTGTATQILYANTAPNVVITAVGLLAFGRKRLYALSFGQKWDNLISKLASLTYAIYLVHDFFVIALERGLGGLSIALLQPTLSVLTFSCWVFLLCTPVAYLLRKIPVLNRYIA